MRIPSGDIPIQPLQHLWERHHEIARRLVAGDKPIEICRAMNMSPSRLSIISNSPIFKIYMSELSAAANASSVDIQGRIQALAVDSMTILEDAIRKKQEGIAPVKRVEIAQDVLDRAGHGAIKKEMHASLRLTGEDIDEMRRARDTARAESARVINPVGDAQ